MPAATGSSRNSRMNLGLEVFRAKLGFQIPGNICQFGMLRRSLVDALQQFGSSLDFGGVDAEGF